ncbi:MAG TPA: glutathione S-transferase C-terminal domain-containing protein [Polyangia bacterium]|jgi:glutathione S-transferase|nr:glutathione S-transferase C-terminal domain-containing protein [Polyangia bacterium]
MLRFVSLEEARAASGLRLVVTAGVPSPWSETAKSCFDAKGIDYVAVRLTPRDADTRAWTNRHNAPVAMYDDEPPRSTWAEIIALAERLGDRISLVPKSQGERVEMWGIAHEILGEGGLVWSLRLEAIHQGLTTGGARGFTERAARYLGARYGYDPSRIDSARDRIQSTLRMLAQRLADGRRYLVGGALSAADICLATALGVLAPLSHAECPMLPDFRRTYETWAPEIAGAVAPSLIAHRDYVYRQHLLLPVQV